MLPMTQGLRRVVLYGGEEHTIQVIRVSHKTSLLNAQSRMTEQRNFILASMEWNEGSFFFQTVESSAEQVAVFNPDTKDWALRRTTVSCLGNHARCSNGVPIGKTYTSTSA